MLLKIVSGSLLLKGDSLSLLLKRRFGVVVAEEEWIWISLLKKSFGISILKRGWKLDFVAEEETRDLDAEEGWKLDFVAEEETRDLDAEESMIFLFFLHVFRLLFVHIAS